MQYTVRSIKKKFVRCVKEVGDTPWLYTKNPEKDFTRNRKLTFEKMISLILCIRGGSLTNELLDCFKFNPDTPTTSAFVQQRLKILPKAFESVFHKLNNTFPLQKKYKGYNLIAVDGSDLHIPTDINDKETYFPGRNGQKPYNLLHLNAAYDLCNNRFIDAIVQKSKNEHKAFVDMVDRLDISKTIFIADRNYESYNNMAHVQEKDYKFLIRIKDINSTGIASGLSLPDKDEFDLPLHLLLTRQKSRERESCSTDKIRYKVLSNSSPFDYLPKRSNKAITITPYELFTRIVRFKISDDSYEMVITNLTEDEFSSDEIKALYALRWGIETSFRDLKYTVGLLYFHTKKVECIIQEIFAQLTMYNFTQMIVATVSIQQKKRTHSYKVNFSAAAHICRQYLRINIPPPEVEALILKHIVPIRPHRNQRRQMTTKTVVSFMYRIA